MAEKQPKPARDDFDKDDTTGYLKALNRWEAAEKVRRRTASDAAIQAAKKLEAAAKAKAAAARKAKDAAARKAKEEKAALADRAEGNATGSTERPRRRRLTKIRPSGR
jgi:hypothetical protein